MTDTRKHLLLIAIGCLLVYANSLGNGLVWDDHFLITDNIYLSEWRNLPKLFTTNLFAGSGNPSAFYRPIQSLTYMIEYQLLWGLKPFGYHLVNLFLHLGSALLLYFLLVPLAGRLPALVTGLLFAVHPLNTEAITYISGRADPLAFGFILLSLLAYQHALAFPARRWYRIASLAAFGLALLSKEMATIFPALLILYDLVSNPPAHPREAASRLWRRYLPYLLVLTLYAGLRLVIRDLQSAPGGGPAIAIGRRLLLAVRVLGDYLGLLLVPRGLHMERSVPTPTSLFDPPVLSGLVALLLLLGLIWWGWRRSRPLAFGIGWFLTGFLPISNLVPLNAFLAEHWMYLPAVGLFFVVGLGIGALQARGLQRWVALPIALVLVLYAGLAIRRNRDWRDDVTFYTLTMKSAPDSWRISSNLSRVYLRNGEVERAIQSFQTVQRLNPRHPDGYIGMGMAYRAMGRDEDAIRQFEMALLTYPKSIMAHLQLAKTYMKMGFHDRAMEYYRLAPESGPRSAVAYIPLAEQYLKEGKYAEAIEAYQKGLEVAPQNVVLRANLGWAYLVTGEDEKAREEFEQALKIDPKSVLVRNHLGSYFLKLGRWQAAAEQFQEALRINPDFADAHSNLGVALHNMGRRQEAEAEIRRALALKPDSAEFKKNLEMVAAAAATPDPSLAQLQREVKLNPDSARAHFNLGSVYGNQGELKKASSELQTALRLDPRNPLIHYAIGLLHYQKGERGLAQRAWERAVALDPAFAPARGRLAELKATDPVAERAR